MRTFLLCLSLIALPAAAQTVTLLQFSDYHSHAEPFYSEDREGQGGIAHAIAYLKAQKKSGALIFSGGDTINKDAPAWSDKYRCAEWPWLNNLVDAMAFGNHDADYGMDVYRACEDDVTYPILSANTVGFRRYQVFAVDGVRIGVFALAGADFPQLVKTPGLVFGDPVATAREVVRELREKEKVDAVVLIGHQHTAEAEALAKNVAGIDLIFGSHSHEKRELAKIDGTRTWMISPSQYLTYISRVELTFDRGLKGVRGKLVRVDASLGEDAEISRKVGRMQSDLESDPKFRELFVPLGRLDQAMSVDALGRRTVAMMKKLAEADVALSTTSSFRQALPAGTLTMETLRAAMPYDNEIVVCTMDGLALQRVLDRGRAAGEGLAYIDAPAKLDPAKSYRIATTDYVAFVAYKDLFACERQQTGKRVRKELSNGFR